MKHFAVLFTVCVAVLLIAVPATGQVRASTVGVAFSDLTYAASAKDTSSGQYFGGANRLSLVVVTADSAELDIIVQYKLNNTTWTTVLTDSLITTTAAGATQEYSIIDSDSDLFDGVAFPVRVVVGGQATGCGVTTPTFTATWHYRP